MKLKPNSNNIGQEITQLNSQLYIKLLEQINKDFNLCGIQWEGYDAIQPINLLSEVDAVIQNTLQKEGDTTIYGLLYRIDVNEKVIRQTNFTNTEEITKLVLSREMEKIWLRVHYSK